MKKFYLLTTTLFFSLITYAQEEEFSSHFTDYMEDLMEEESTKLDYEELLNVIEDIRSNKINLNTATERELSQLPYLNEIDAHNIIQHRKSYGFFQTLYELKNIPNFDYDKIKHILPFITIDQEKEKMSWKQEFKTCKHLIYNQYQQTMQKKKGYIPDSLGNTKYAGIPCRYYFKYQLQTAEKISLGFLGERDAGEPFGLFKNGIFDFKSAYLQLKDIWKFKQINIGDYKANFGQGLVIGNSCLFGKSVNTLNEIQQYEGLKRYTSSNECGQLRGLGTTFAFKDWEVTTFLSCKKIDVNINGSTITSFKTDGLHRTENEISKRLNATEKVIGCNLAYTKKNLKLGYTFLAYQYSNILNPTDVMYNYFKLRNTNHHFNTSIHYKYYFQRMSFFGECAIDANKGLATLNGISILPNSRIGILALQRCYQPEYQANFSHAFGENSRTENEKGFYIGTKILPVKKLELSLYADVFSFPWAKYKINYPSKGEDFLVQAQINAHRKMNMQLKYKYKNYIEQGYTKQDIRYVNHWKIGKFETQSILEANKIRTEESDTYGWVVSEDIQREWSKPHLSMNLHYAYYVASDYNNRFYIYERDILNTFSMPQLYGKGHRIDINFKWAPCRLFQIYLNYGMYLYTDGRETISSSNEEIKGNRSSMIKGLMRWSF